MRMDVDRIYMDMDMDMEEGGGGGGGGDVVWCGIVVGIYIGHGVNLCLYFLNSELDITFSFFVLSLSLL